jgi:hypothetical protein
MTRKGTDKKIRVTCSPTTNRGTTAQTRASIKAARNLTTRSTTPATHSHTPMYVSPPRIAVTHTRHPRAHGRPAGPPLRRAPAAAAAARPSRVPLPLLERLRPRARAPAADDAAGRARQPHRRGRRVRARRRRRNLPARQLRGGRGELLLLRVRRHVAARHGTDPRAIGEPLLPPSTCFFCSLNNNSFLLNVNLLKMWPEIFPFCSVVKSGLLAKYRCGLWSSFIADFC